VPKRTTKDQLISDVITPVKGPDLAERMLALRPEMKVLFMSGYANSDVVRITCAAFLWDERRTDLEEKTTPVRDASLLHRSA
jgi:hypothetical protein